ncbi:hypothetical protein GCM10027049_10600 [Mucilaginibacter puniceus]
MTSSYPGFDYKADELRKFLASTDIFTILLKNGKIIHFTALDKNSFQQWLIEHNIENIKFDK